MNDSTIHDIWSLIEIRRLAEAREMVQKELANDPGDAELYYAAAYIESEFNNLYDSLEICEQGLALAPENASLQYLRFQLLADLEQYSDAESIIIDLIARFPRNEAYLTGYSKLMLKTFHLEKSRQLCNEALRIAPDYQPAKVQNYILGIVEGDKHLQDQELSDLVRNDPNSEYVLCLIANNLIQEKRYREAQRVTQELIQISPHSTEYIAMLIEVRTMTHWSSAPNWFFNRFGWPAAIGLWLVIIAISKTEFASEGGVWANVVIFGYLALVIYSWLQPPLLKRWLGYRGV